MKHRFTTVLILLSTAISLTVCAGKDENNSINNLLPLLLGGNGPVLGVPDGSFNGGGSGISGGVGTIMAIAIQADGKVLVGGDFSAYNGSSNIPKCLMRLNRNGSVDTEFNFKESTARDGANNTVRAIVELSDGKILIGGGFTQYNGVDVPDGIIRLNSDGTRDTAFNSTNSGTDGGFVYAIALQKDYDVAFGTRILIGGEFHSYNGDAAAPDHLVRLFSDGSRDTGFSSSPDNYIQTIVVEGDNSFLIGGTFANYRGFDVPDRIIRANNDGLRDASFNGVNPTNGADDLVNTIDFQSDGKIIVGGRFNTYGPDTTPTPDHIMRLLDTGLADTGFISTGTADGTIINALRVMSDDRILVGGSFTTYNDDEAPDNFMMLKADGTLDDTFNAGGSGAGGGAVNAIAVQADGKVIIGGSFTTYNGTAVPACLIRLK